MSNVTHYFFKSNVKGLNSLPRICYDINTFCRGPNGEDLTDEQIAELEAARIQAQWVFWEEQ